MGESADACRAGVTAGRVGVEDETGKTGGVELGVLSAVEKGMLKEQALKLMTNPAMTSNKRSFFFTVLLLVSPHHQAGILPTQAETVRQG